MSVGCIFDAPREWSLQETQSSEMVVCDPFNLHYAAK